MPDVRVTNPKVQITLNDDETTTVPSGERWIVDLTRFGSNEVQLRDSTGKAILNSLSDRFARVRLSGGDVVKAKGSTTVGIRGDVIST